MYSRLILSLSAAAVIAGLPATSFAADAAACSTIQWQPNRVYVLRAKLHHAVHIVLPEPMSGKPVWGNPDLWTVDGQSTHVFIKPTNSDNAEGASTSLAIVGQSNTSYDFTIRRVRDTADDCVYIKKDGALISSDTDWRTQEEKQKASLQKQIETMQKQITEGREAAQQQANAAVDEYRGRVYTAYEWGKGKGFMGKEVISDVWDDGRFTFIRVTQDNKGLMQVTAGIDGRDEFIEYDYDSNKKLYTLAGLYPTLTMHYDKSTIKITRKSDSDT